MTSDPGTSHLHGRTVVVTGAGSGFGRLISELAAARGAKVVTDLDAMNALARATVERYGAIDVMINNAGTMPLAFMADHASAADAWDRCIDVNLKGVLHGIAAVYDQMIHQGRGHIVNIASIYGNAGTAGSGVYSATKAAVVVMSDALRKETQGIIKVTVVRPTGVIATGLAATVVNPAAAAGAIGTKFEPFMAAALAAVSGELDGPPTDIDSPEFWAIEPATIAGEIIHAIDQPWGVVISDVSIRATGEMFTI